VVDNNSTDGTREWLQEQKDIKAILNDDNVGFPRGCNQGIAASDQNNDILFLNNDTVVTPRWLDNLKIGLYSEDHVGGTASTTNNCSNYQSIRVPYTELNDMKAFAEVNNVSNPDQWEEKVRLVAFCMLIKRDVLNKIGLLDERFSPGNFEDDDLCMRVIEAGYKLLLCYDSFIHHFGSTSFKKDYSKFNDLLTTNSKKFEEKWGFNSNLASEIKFDVIERISEPKDKHFKIVDFDCGLGATLLKLKYMYPKALIYGIETNPSIARLGGELVELMTENFEETYTMSFNSDMTNFFDYIILGNKLQLSNDPWKLLKAAKSHLKPGGYVIATIPNMMHHSVIKELLTGSFIYQENALLNKHNSKFFTLSDIHKIFEECGYINPFVFHYTHELTLDAAKFIDSICSIIGNDMREYFYSYEYVAKFQKSLEI